MCRFMVVMSSELIAFAESENKTTGDAMDVLLSELNEAIDDMENGRVQTIEEAWKEIDAI